MQAMRCLTIVFLKWALLATRTKKVALAAECHLLRLADVPSSWWKDYGGRGTAPRPVDRCTCSRAPEGQEAGHGEIPLAAARARLRKSRRCPTPSRGGRRRSFPPATFPS